MQGWLKKFRDCDIIKYQPTTLKSKEISNYYFDARSIYSQPELFKNVVDFFLPQIDEGCKVVGVPLGAVPLATAIAFKKSRSLLLARESQKTYGLKKQLEGSYSTGDKVILIEDVITTGGSVKKVIDLLRDKGLKVVKIVCVLNRKSINFVSGVKVISMMTGNIIEKELTISNRLRWIMDKKKTRVCYSADDLYGDKIHDALGKIESVAPYICMLKIHPDIALLTDDVIDILKRLSRTHNFLLLVDRKFADIGKIVKLQIKKHSYADLVTAHLISGSGIVTAVEEVSKEIGKDIGVLAIAEMSTGGNLIDKKYTEKVVEIGEKMDNVVGYITQSKLSDKLCCMPGISNSKTRVADQGYTKSDVAFKRGLDIVIVGSSVYNNRDPVAEIKKYM